MDPDNYLVTEKTAAEMLGVTTRSLQAWRYKGGGPPFVRISARCVRYRISDLKAWTAKRIARSTCDVTEAEEEFNKR